jgi:hypothetical protein
MWKSLPWIALLLLPACSSDISPPNPGGDGGVLPFQSDPPSVYVAKVKNLLVGLPPTDDEVKAVVADPGALPHLIDTWMMLPEYQSKMMVFFELSFQQTQVKALDFAEIIPQFGLDRTAASAQLLQNVRESFARTVLELINEGQPITAAFSTKRLMMTPAMMELYAFLDARQVDDKNRIIDTFANANPTLNITLEAAQGPIPVAQSLNPASPNYMHWYSPDVATLNYPNTACNVDPVVLPAKAYSLHALLYGAIDNHTAGGGNCPMKTLTANSVQVLPTDFTTWKMVTIRPPRTGEAISTFYDLPTLRNATELVVKTPRVGFFSTPAFGANWSTNASNQMRVTTNQTLIVATGKQIDGTDMTAPTTTPGLDPTHTNPGTACFGCHRLLDPTRSILAATFSWNYASQTEAAYMGQKGLFAFEGVIQPVQTLDDFAQILAQHPATPVGWAQKLCYYINSAPCSEDDPEFQRVLGVFKSQNMSWNALVRELLSSPIVTNASQTKTSQDQGEVIAVMRRDHLCSALNQRLGLTDVCGLQATTRGTTVTQIAAGLPSDGYGRGSTVPVLPNQPTLFYRAGLENICAKLADQVIDAPTNSKWSSSQPDAAIADFVATMLALTPSDPRSAPATQLLTTHFHSAMGTGASATDSLKSTFVVSCLAPTFSGIGM